jgi:hypothetical protein
MKQPEMQISTQDKVVSPVEERHIDYILEEEFAVDPDFLRFFLEQARFMASDPGRIVGCTDKSDCIAVRSVSTEHGETDLLVTYRIQDGMLPAAILIENKIRAAFQPEQAARYRKRGEEGKGRYWSEYWTCLVSHERYSVGSGEFDALVTLQVLQEYFKKAGDKGDKRSQFRDLVLKQTI